MLLRYSISFPPLKTQWPVSAFGWCWGELWQWLFMLSCCMLFSTASCCRRSCCCGWNCLIVAWRCQVYCCWWRGYCLFLSVEALQYLPWMWGKSISVPSSVWTMQLSTLHSVWWNLLPSRRTSASSTVLWKLRRPTGFLKTCLNPQVPVVKRKRQILCCNLPIHCILYSILSVPMYSLWFLRVFPPGWWQLWEVSRILPSIWIAWVRKGCSLRTSTPTVSVRTVGWWLSWVAILPSPLRVLWSIPVKRSPFLPLQAACGRRVMVPSIIMAVMPTLPICVPTWCHQALKTLFPTRIFP